MQIASFVLPYTDTRGPRYEPAHQEARCRLLNTFGGFTTSEVKGAWLDTSNDPPVTYYDNSIRYEIASEWTIDLLHKFRDIIQDTGQIANQKCVYAVYDGIAEILEII